MASSIIDRHGDLRRFFGLACFAGVARDLRLGCIVVFGVDVRPDASRLGMRFRSCNGAPQLAQDSSCRPLSRSTNAARVPQ